MHKYIYDSIHKQILVHPTVLTIINTYPFQRLRYLKQLSVTDYVFPTANHTRFEHSIGVSYLAGKIIRCISSKQPELDINDDDILKVEIAGLCHDLGHGPFCHTFDKFLESIGIKSNMRHHEKRSCWILEYIVKKYNININPEMLSDIQDLIYPSGKTKNNKPFLYHIISNPSNGIDVDKFDYLKRDVHNLGLPYGIDLERLLETARVINNEICYPEKMIFSISNIFEIRGRLHKEVYNHPVVYSIELMIIDMLNNLDYKWQTYLDDVELYLTLTDNIITQINPKLTDAIQIRNQIWERKLYKYAGQIIIPNNIVINLEIIEQFKQQYSNLFEDDNVVICHLHIGYQNNPLMKVKFYDVKKDPNTSYYFDKDKISPLLPTNYEETTIRVYIKDKDMLSVGKYCLTELQKFIT